MPSLLLNASPPSTQSVSTALWPYALCHTAYLNNVLRTLEGGAVETLAFQLNLSWIQHAFHAYFWVPCFYTQQLSNFKQGHP